MAAGRRGHQLGLPTTSAAFINFALDVVDLLKQAQPGGLDKDGFLNVYFSGKPPTSQSDRDAWWKEFKRAVRYSSKRFDNDEPPWAFIRARPVRGRYFYEILAQRSNDRVEIKDDPGSLTLLDDFTNRRWETQTKSRQRVRASLALALIDSGNGKNDQRLVDKGQDLLNEFITLSPGLAAVNFGSGIVMEDLDRLAKSRNPHIRLLRRQIQDARRSGSRFERDLANLTGVVLMIADVYNKGSKKALP